MSEDAQSNAVTNAYALLGRAAAGYAALEFHLQFLLSMLISGHELTAEAVLLIKDKNFSQRISTLREFTLLRIPRNLPLRQKALDLVRDLDAARKKRNLFIHGYWLVNYPLIASTGSIRCSDTHWSFDPEKDNWKSMATTDYPLATLEDIIKNTAELTQRVHRLLAELRSTGKEPAT